MRYDLFPTPVWHIEGAPQQLVDELYQGAYRFKKKYPSTQMTNCGGYQSPAFESKEFHPKGIRVDKTNAHRYNIVSGNYESIISGEEKKSITGDYTVNLKGKLTFNSVKDISIVSDNGDIVMDSVTNNTYIGGKNVILDAKQKIFF